MKNIEFSWNVWMWDPNSDKLKTYDVVPLLVRELELLKKKDLPKTEEDFCKFLEDNTRYHFWSKTECEIMVGNLFSPSTAEKKDIYSQLRLNWDTFTGLFWKAYEKSRAKK